MSPPSKNITLKVLDFLIPLALCVIIVSNITFNKHKAIPNISLGCLIGFLAIRAIFFKISIPKREIVLPLLIFCGVYFVYWFSVIIQSENAYNIKYLMQFRSIIPAYILAIIFLPSFSARQYYLFFTTHVIAAVVYSVIVLWNYIWLVVLHQGDAFIHPTWRNFIDLLYPFIIPFKLVHHNFSFFILFAIFLNYYILKSLATNKNTYYKSMIVTFIFLIFILHFVSARLSLFLFYAAALIELCHLAYNKVISTKNFIILLIIPFFLFTCGYFLVPTLRTKVNITVLGKIEKGDIVENESVGKNLRLISLKIGLEAAKEHLWLGLPFSKEDEYFNKKNGQYFNDPSLLRLRTHNQLLYNIITLGLPLSLVWLFCFLFPLFYKAKTNTLPLYFLYIAIISYFFVDNPIQLKPFFYYIFFWIPFLKFYSTETYSKLQKSNSIENEAMV